MQTMNQALFTLFSRKLISLDDALGWSMDPEELRQMMASPNIQPRMNAPMSKERR
jgi:twitching motility protein PilT